MRNDYLVTSKVDGTVIAPGDTVLSFRGEAFTFVGVSRPPLPGKSAKVIVAHQDVPGATREYYDSVFGLNVEALPEGRPMPGPTDRDMPYLD